MGIAQMLTRTLLTVGKPIDKDEWVVCLSNDVHRLAIPCGRVEWSLPCYGKELLTDEIEQLIRFLQQTLKGRDHDQSNME